MKYSEIKKCRICGNTQLVPLLDLGEQALTGVFPRSKDEPLTRGPLQLVKCSGVKESEFCGLVQLRHTYVKDELYGNNYGYHSSLNASMARHLQGIAKEALSRVTLEQDDAVVDIGSNDGTLLKAYPQGAAMLVGIDPTGAKFREFYPEHIHLIPEFFSAEKIKAVCGNRKVKIVTSIAMFYDLDFPLDFMRQVHEILADDGIWFLEQSYLPSMLEVNAYDTICHEHLEYYCLRQIKWLADRAGLKIISVKLDSVNGGSFAVAAAKKESPFPEEPSVIKLLHQEELNGLQSIAPYAAFKERVLTHRQRLRDCLEGLIAKGSLVLGYGASTKGNVLLQFCGITPSSIPFVAEVNKDKFGCFTPGTHIPIISEDEARAMKPDYFLVLPWHFRDNIISREQAYLKQGGRLLFPLPRVEFFSL